MAKDSTPLDRNETGNRPSREESEGRADRLVPRLEAKAQASDLRSDQAHAGPRWILEIAKAAVPLDSHRLGDSLAARPVDRRELLGWKIPPPPEPGSKAWYCGMVAAVPQPKRVPKNRPAASPSELGPRRWLGHRRCRRRPETGRASQSSESGAYRCPLNRLHRDPQAKCWVQSRHSRAAARHPKG